jgi:acyl-CoA-binding protein
MKVLGIELFTDAKSAIATGVIGLIVGGSFVGLSSSNAGYYQEKLAKYQYISALLEEANKEVKKVINDPSSKEYKQLLELTKKFYETGEDGAQEYTKQVEEINAKLRKKFLKQLDSTVEDI